METMMFIKSVESVKCPECGSKEFDIFDVEYTHDYRCCYPHCNCEKCGEEFIIEYVVADIL